MNETLAVIIVLPTMFAGFCFVAWVLASNIRRTKVEKVQAEMQARLLDKMSSSQELVQYLQSDAGKQFLQPPPVASRSPFSRILRSIHWGLILTFLGIGFLFMTRFDPGGEGLIFIGIVGLALGLGFLVSSGISYALSKNWGLLDRETPDTEVSKTPDTEVSK